jgi:hypothetical protein
MKSSFSARIISSHASNESFEVRVLVCVCVCHHSLIFFIADRLSAF